MTIGDWLASRTPPPPPALRARLAAALAGAEIDRESDVVLRCLTAAERIMTEVLGGECTSRDSALDLLTADALVTYAFEAAAETPADLAAHATDAMRRFAALAAAPRERAVAE